MIGLIAIPGFQVCTMARKVSVRVNASEVAF